MQPAQRPLQRVAHVVVLHESRVDPDRGKIARIPHLQEKSSHVADTLRHDDFDFRATLYLKICTVECFPGFVGKLLNEQSA